MNDFKQYLKGLADAQQAKALASAEGDDRQRILISSGVLLNWLGDFLGDSKLQWELRVLPVNEVLMTGVDPEINKILIGRAERMPERLGQMMNDDPALRDKLYSWAGDSGDAPILVRPDEQAGGKWKVLDGMHRFVRAVVTGQAEISAYVPINMTSFRPTVEPHVIYDLIRGYWRSARDEQSQDQLYHALRLMVGVYGNVAELLKTRFGPDWENEHDLQTIIRRVLAE